MKEQKPARKGKGGAPKKPADEVLSPYNVGLNTRQRAKVAYHGGWPGLRKIIDALPEPKP